MNNLTQNYKIILEKLTENCSHIESFSQVRQPKLSNLELVAINITAEYMSYNSELQLFKTIKRTELEDKIERSVYNKRRRRLIGYTEKNRQSLSQKFAHLSNLFIVDSAPVQICKNSRAKRSNICATYEIQPSFGYCAAQKTHYFGYNLHLVCDENSIVHSFDLAPANIHDINYLKDIKYNLKSCELVGDRAYISADYQTDLFQQSQIKLFIPMRSNSLNPTAFSPVKRQKRKRIETLISQLVGQFAMNVNLAKTLKGLIVRISAKITAITINYSQLFYCYAVRPIRLLCGSGRRQKESLEGRNFPMKSRDFLSLPILSLLP